MSGLRAAALATLFVAPSPPPPVVTVSAPEAVTVAAGKKAEARVEVKVKEGFRVQANPASEPYLIPLRLEMAETPRVRPGTPVYPVGRPYRLQGTEKELSTYEGTFEIRVPVEVAAGASPGDERLEGVLRYQACDARICLRPTSVPVSLPVQVTLSAR